MISAPDFAYKRIVFVFTASGDKISFKNDNLIVKDKEGKVKHQSTAYKLFMLGIVGSITITSGLLQRSKKFGFTIVCMTYNMHVYGLWPAGIEGNTLLHRIQFEYKDDKIAKKLVANKIDEQLFNLKKIRNKDDDLLSAIERLNSLKKEINFVSNFQDLLGVEGNASRIYFKRQFVDCLWIKRMPRAKIDIVNVLLDIGYTLLFNFLEALLRCYGFDVYQGVYHKLFYMRKSLVCDLVEPFRPIIDDKIVKAWHLGQINKRDFNKVKKQFFLYGKNSTPYIKMLQEAILEHKETIFYYVQNYYRSFIRKKDINDFPYFIRE